MPDLEDAELELDRMEGVENSWTGKVLARLVKATRFLHGRQAILNNRVQTLEDRVAAIEARIPPEQ